MALIFPTAAQAALQTPIWTFSNVSTPLTNTANDVIYYYDNTIGVWLTEGEGGALPGGVTSVNVSGGTTGLTYTGGPITSSGLITMAGTLALTNGGTGATTQAGAQANLLPTQTGNAGKVLSTDGAGVISWITAVGAGTVTSITAGTGLTGGTITSSGTVALADTAVVSGSYTYSSITVDQQGRLTSASSGTSPVTSIGIIGTNGIGVVSGSPVTTSGSITLAINVATLPVLP